MIRIFSDMDRYIQDYKIQRQMAENKKSIQPLPDIAKTKDFTRHNDSSLHQNLNTSDNLFSDILSEEIEKVSSYLFFFSFFF